MANHWNISTPQQIGVFGTFASSHGRSRATPTRGQAACALASTGTQRCDLGGTGVKQAIARIRSDLRHGRNREAYAIFLVGAVLTPLGLAGAAPAQLVSSAILLSLTFLVFHTTIQPGGRPRVLDDVLQNRESFTPFPQLLAQARTLWIYGPTAVNVTGYAADIRQRVLARGGTVKVIVQDPASVAKDDVRSQLDDNHDFDQTLTASLATLSRLRRAGNIEYRLLGFSPGFSMVVVNPDQPSGFLIVEFHGFKDDNITERMHVKIGRSESAHWFDYWTARFTAMWNASREPEPAVSPDPP
jgi:hypothetical protein